MRKIVIITNKLSIGGCEQALISLLNIIDYSLYDITLLVKETGGRLEYRIPSAVKIMQIPCANQSFNQILKYHYRDKNYLKLFKCIFSRIRMLCCSNIKYYSNYVNLLPKIEKEFDVAISYYFPGEFSEWYCLNNIIAREKIVWIHSDVSKLNLINNHFWRKMYKRYDQVICVSKEAQKKFIEYIPSIKNKTQLIYNYIDSQDIIDKSLENNIKIEFSTDNVNIITVGRLSFEKGQLKIPYILKKLLDDGLNIVWYCIGEGPLREDLEELIQEMDLSRNLILLGVKENPYKYIKKSDIYVQTSTYEGFCITLAEAKILNKPIITTNFTGAQEQIKHNFNGLVVEDDIESLYLSIKSLIISGEKRKKIIKQLQKEELMSKKDYQKIINNILNKKEKR